MQKPKLRPRIKPAQERRAELLNAAEGLFIAQGVGPTTIEQITAAADVAKGTFYLYFSSKEHLLSGLRERFAQLLLEKIKTAIAHNPAQDWRGKLASWAKGGVEGYLDSARLHDITFHESRPPTLKGRTDNIIVDHLLTLLEAGAAARAWSIEGPRLTAVFLFSGLHGVVDDTNTRERRVNRRELVQRLERLCFRAVGLPTA
jgi:AcrR family transcriptional regulator